MLRRVVLALCGLLVATAAGAQILPGRSPGFRSGFQFIGAGGFPTPGAVVDYDFRNDRYTGPAISVTRSSAAYVDDAAGNWTLVPANTLRRSNKGALIEGAQTNAIRNNSMQGAVVGSPGTLPTNWGLTSGGLTLSVVGIGTESGIDYIDVRFSGTPSNTFAQLFFETSTGVAAAAGQIWTASFFHKLVGGSLANISAINCQSAIIGGSGSVSVPLAPGMSALGQNRASATATAGAGATNARPAMSLALTVGAAVDFTVRIGWPQLEQWSTSVTSVGGASSPIRTTGVAATRAADVVTGVLTSALSTLSLAGVVQPIIPTLSGGILRVGTASDRIDIRASSTTGAAFQAQPVVGSAAQAQLNAAAGSLPAATRNAFAYAGTSGDQAASIAGGAIVSNAPALFPTATALTVGGGGQPWNGYIERLVIYSARPSNAQLQTLSTLSNWGG